jgi:predicted O-linked N-acetylglucosamine transferase (SPINDLY family)
MTTTSLRRPTPRDAERAEAHRQAGLQASRVREWERARREFECATKLAPADALMWMNLARACSRLADLPAATAASMRAFDLDPASPVACRMAAEALVQQHRAHDAVRLFERLSPKAERDHEFHSAHGNVLFLARRPREAVDAYFRSLALNVDAALVHYRLGLCFMDLAMPLEAAECFRSAVALDAGQVRALSLSLLVQEGRQACDWSRTDEDTRALLAAVDAADRATGRLLSPFALLAIDATPQQLLHIGTQRCLGLADGVAPLPAPGPRRPGPLRIGYLSADFHQHATAWLMTELLECRDTSRFEVTLYSHSPDDGSDIGHRVRAACERFVDVNGLTHREIAEHIRADGIDVLVDLKGHTRDSRMEVLAYRPAPVQATYLGYPATTGAAFIDYFIGDPVVTPLSHAAHYSERIAQLPVCYQPNDRSRPLPPASARATLGLPEDAVVLCCFNQTYKLSPHMLDLWARVLRGAPRAVLWMLAWNPHARANLTRELQARGIGEDRVFFAPKLDLAGHIARLRAADLFLDTWPCNAHTTASEALWAGVPVLTVPGPTFASRVAASLVTACGLPDLACPDDDAYVSVASALANEPATLQGVKAYLESRRAVLPLFDADRLARDLEALYARMHERRLAGLPPEALPAVATPAPASMESPR